MTLEQVQKYCKGKRIIIVGNSSRILQSNQGRFIDGHDVVVRMNYALPLNQKFAKHIGTKTDIFSVSIHRSVIAHSLFKRSPVRIVLRLPPYSEQIVNHCVYSGTLEDYDEIKDQIGTKPSTGLLTFRFFEKYVDCASIDIIGFDFFESSHEWRKNEFKSFHYHEHSAQKEKEYIISRLSSTTKLIRV